MTVMKLAANKDNYSSLTLEATSTKHQIYAKSLPEPDIATKHQNENNSKYSNEKYRCFLGEFETKIYWGNLIIISSLHLAFLYLVFVYNIVFRGNADIVLKRVTYGLIFGYLTGFGTTGGAHRYWTHRCFKAKLPLQLIFLLCYSMAGQNSIYNWVRDHRVHHKFSETNADPHDSRRGFLFAHVGWLCMKKRPEVITKGKTVDMSDVTSDPLLAFHIRHWVWIQLIFCFILPSVIPPYLYGESWTISILGFCIVRYVLLLNFTWCVNSFAHIWGNRPYNSKIRPVQNIFVSFFTLGEGWHNYHHCFPWDYRAAEMGTFLNGTTLILNMFAKIGWAYDLQSASPKVVENMVKSIGDGTHSSIADRTNKSKHLL